MRGTARDVLPSAFLYVPANRPERFSKALAVSPAIILDLEDSVPLQHKEQARVHVREYLRGGEPAAKVWVRVSAQSLEEDLAAIPADAAVAGVMVAKAGVEAVRQCAAARPDLAMIALIEDARSLSSLDEISRTPNLVTFAVGEADLLADLRIRRTPENSAVIDTVRLSIVQAAAAAELQAPLAPTSLEIRDLGAVATTTARLRDLGFRSRTAIHPDQCAVIIDVFTPSPEEIAVAEEIIASLAAAQGGVAVLPNGRFVDRAVAREAEETLGRLPSVKENNQ